MNNVLAVADIKSCVEKVAPIYGVERVSLFGSYANGKRTKKSDIDLLVRFPDTATLLTLAGFKNNLEKQTNKTVDVVPSPIPDDSFLEIDKEVLLYEKK